MSRVCASGLLVEGSLGPSGLKREAGCVRGPGQMVLLSRDPDHWVGWRVRCQASEYLVTYFFSDAEHMGHTVSSPFRSNLPSCFYDGRFPRRILEKTEDVKLLQRRGSRNVRGSCVRGGRTDMTGP